MVDNQAMDADIQQFRWQQSAACNGAPSYLFFPEEMTLPDFKEDPAYEGKVAKDFCGSCIVRNVCKEFALLHDAWGIWGNTQKGERDRIYPQGERREMRALKYESGNYTPLHGEAEAPDPEDWLWAS